MRWIPYNDVFTAWIDLDGERKAVCINDQKSVFWLECIGKPGGGLLKIRMGVEQSLDERLPK